MASWSDLANYLRATYTISEEQGGGDGLLMEFKTEGRRTQLVMVSRARLMDGAEEWAIIESPIGDLDEVNLRAAIDAVGKMVCGGLGLRQGRVTLKHSVPLASLDIDEFERPFVLLTNSADEVEASLLGKDAY